MKTLAGDMALCDWTCSLRFRRLPRGHV
uniref:Uncharacterized protein n=1 Tax=Anguilla anguilla TaxID=7936 RepID=A0A0E9RY35_ANGAN